MRPEFAALLIASLLAAACQRSPAPIVPAKQAVDLLIVNGLIVDGTGGAPAPGGVAIRDGRVVALGDVAAFESASTVDAQGLAVAPGFINTLSWAGEALIADGRGLSDIVQGVTLEVMGEGFSMGPLNAAMKADLVRRQGDLRYPVDWTTLGEFLEGLVRRGVAPNVASFVGATTLRVHEIGYADRPPTPEELARMQALARAAMEEGALGIGASLIYAPAFYAKPDELAALVKVAAAHGGGYIAHLRSEGNRFLEALDELIGIARSANTWAEVYHLKAAGEANWPKMAQAIAKIEAARKEGLAITANMYAYTAGATGLDAAMPPWVQEGGLEAWAMRLKDPKIRAKLREEIARPATSWENWYVAAGSPDRILLIGFKNDQLKKYTGKSLAAIAEARGTPPIDTMMDLVIEDGSRISTAYFVMSEDNVRLGLSQPWVSLGSDEEAQAPEGVFLKSNPHPRAYGNVARFLGHYARDGKLMGVADAVRRLTALPAANFRLEGRGCIAPGCFADVVIFDPATVIDHATFDRPHQLATGVRDVFVNGTAVLRDGKPTDARPGVVVRGPGWKPRSKP